MESTTSNVIKKKSKVIPKIIVLLVILLSFCAIIYYGTKKVKSIIASSPSIKAIEEKWQVYDYEGVHKISHDIIQKEPFNNIALIYHGYSCFYLSVSQIDTTSAKDYLDEAITSMRVALYDAKKDVKGQLEYMLGKAYFYKNTITSYYYADLALKYFSLAKEDGFSATDIFEYMGLSFAALGRHMESISSFTEALLTRESPSLLMSIAEEYYKVGQPGVAKQYLYRIKKDAIDNDLVLKSMNLLGNIYIDEGDFVAAEREFSDIISQNENFPDAYYGLGVVYENEGDLVKARFQWRKALKIKPNHALALEKMSGGK